MGSGDFTAYVCDSAATRPSSQITLGKLVIILLKGLKSEKQIGGMARGPAQGRDQQKVMDDVG